VGARPPTPFPRAALTHATVRTPRSGERALLVRIGLGSPVSPAELEEFAALAVSAGAVPLATVTGSRAKPDPRFFVGSGKAEELKQLAEQHDAEVILVDHPLSPSQERNLEKLTGRRVLDRSGLILDIFAQRARKPRRQAAGRARAAEAPGDAARPRLDPPRKAEGRHRPARSRRDAARDRPPTARQAHPHAESAAREARAAARHGPQGAVRRDVPVPASRSSATRTPASRRCSTR
jgi:hypothetical protein